MKNITYTSVLDKYGFPQDSPNSPEGTVADGHVPWKFGLQQKIQTRQMKASNVAIRSFVKLSNSALGLGTIANNATAFLTTSLTPQTPHATDPNFAIAYVGVFVGTSPSSYDSAQQIYPILGGSQSAGNWDIRGDYDYNGVGGTLSGTISVWHGMIKNTSGATGTVQFVTRWKYIDFNNGTVT